jgi:hypothetical protein
MMKMKSKILLFALLGVSVLMSSCLGEGSRNYSESSVTYIAMDDFSGKTFGRTLTGKTIISNEIQLMQAGTFKFFTYTWNEEDGTTPIGEILADNVIISGDPIDVSRTTVNMSEGPVQEEPRKFVGIDPPFYARDKFYLGDYWLFQYAYESQKGETAVIQYYVTDDPEANEDEINIDIQLTFTGSPEAGSSTTTKTDIIALNMTPLRAEYEGSSQTSTKELKIKFQYYLKGQEEPIKSQSYAMTVAGD